MIQTPRPWPENAWPTPEQYAAWLKVLTDEECVEVAGQALRALQDSADCFAMNHEGAVGELQDLYRRLPAMLDQARAEGAAAVVADVEAVIEPMGDPTDPRHLHPQAASLIMQARAVLARHRPSEATEGPSEARGGAGGVRA